VLGMRASDSNRELAAYEAAALPLRQPARC
jgi:hypothetical protein